MRRFYLVVLGWLVLLSSDTATADLFVYRDSDLDGWGDTFDSILISDLNVPDGFTRLSHDTAPDNFAFFPEFGPLMSGGFGFYELAVGETVTFDITIDDDTGLGADVDFFDSVLPGAASFTYGVPASTLTGTFEWTPTAADVGFFGFETYAQYSTPDLIGLSEDNINGTFASFHVTAAAVPEPSALGSICVLSLCSLAYRKKRVMNELRRRGCRRNVEPAVLRSGLEH